MATNPDRGKFYTPGASRCPGVAEDQTPGVTFRQMPEVLEMVRLAGEVRSRANLRSPSFSTTLIIEAWFPTALVTGRDLPDGVQEVVSMTDRGPLILYRRGLSSDDKRFAIAHALGHLLFDFNDAGILLADLADPEIEVRADNFALELLAPRDMVALHARDLPDGRDGVDREVFLDRVDRIASRFHAPSWAIAEQIRRLRD